MVNSDNKLESDDNYKYLKYTKIKLKIMVSFNTTKSATIKLFKHRLQINVIPRSSPKVISIFSYIAIYQLFLLSNVIISKHHSCIRCVWALFLGTPAMDGCVENYWPKSTNKCSTFYILVLFSHNPGKM